jgi:hypothetical protein
VKLPKRFDLARAAEHWSAQLSTLIERQLFSHNSQFCGLDQACGRHRGGVAGLLLQRQGPA